MRTDSRSVDDLLQAGLDARGAGEVVVAEQYFRRAMDLDPVDFRPLQFLGAVLIERDDVKDGVDVLTAAADLAGPVTLENVGVYNNLGNALRLAKRRDEAEVMLRRVVEVAPDEWQHWHNLAHVLKDMGREDEAIAPIRRAIAIAPGHGPNYAVLGSILFTLGRLNSAVRAFRRCIDMGWDQDVNTWTQLGGTYRLMGELDQAMVALERALELSGGAPSAHSNLAIALNQQGRFAEAQVHFQAAIDSDPTLTVWRNNYGYSQLTAGEIPEGWDNWEFGLEAEGPRGSERPTGAQRWLPVDTDVRLLCFREQGIGDEIMFASVLPDLSRCVRELVYEPDSRLVSLVARSFPNIEVREQTWNAVEGQLQHDFDRSIPIGSVPVHLRRTLADFPADQGAIFVANPERVAHWRNVIGEFANGNAVIGMSWRSRIKTAERRLEYTQLHEWGELFATPGVTWINLQYDDCERDLVAAEREFGVKIHRWRSVDYMNDFEEVAALIMCCDLVVAPRNAVAMLGGALGKPTLALGNRWDWSDIGTDTSPWLPSIELVSRHVGEEWDEVLATAAARVRAVASRKEPTE